jgi:HEAT repeat protein
LTGKIFSRLICILTRFSLYVFIMLFTGAVSFLPQSSIIAQSTPTTAEIVDSLFIRASSGEVKYRDLVEPSKEALIEMGESAISQMLTKLGTHDAREMHTVVDVFKGIGEVAIDSLVIKLDSQDSFARRLAIRCLGEIKSPRAVEPLVELAGHDDFRTRAGILTALGKIACPDAAFTVMEGLSDADELVVTAAAVACGNIKEGIDPDALIIALSHPYYGVRYSACRSLIELGDIAVKPLLSHIKSRPDDISAGYTIEALGGIGSTRALNIFKETIKSNDWAIRVFTAEALGKIKKSEKILKKALKSETHPLAIGKIKSSLVDICKTVD